MAKLPVKLRKCPEIIRWPVEDTGRNSVNPSIIPITITFNSKIIKIIL